MGKLPYPARLLLVAAALATTLLTSCSNGTEPTRTKVSTKLSESYYIESRNAPRKFSCSFVEFDERGDYLNFSQHTHCWTRIKDLSRQSRVLLILYCHGWKHNAQSSNVLEFNKFLGTLADSAIIKEFVPQLGSKELQGFVRDVLAGNFQKGVRGMRSLIG